MKKLILSLAFGAFMLLPGDTAGFPRPVARPAYRPAPMPVHTPAYVAPRPVAPVYHPAYRPPVAVQPAYRPPVAVQPIVRPPVVTRPPVAVQPIVRPPVVQPIVRPPVAGIGNRPVVVNNRTVLVNRGIYINRGSTYYRPGYSYYHNNYADWHHGYWGGWYSRPWLWFGAGVTAGWLYATTPAVVYANPYWVAPAYVPVYDYGQPIPVPQPVPVPVDTSGTDVYDPTVAQNVQSAPPPPEDANAAGAAKLLDDARQAFLASDFDAALKMADQAISSFPKDATLHEFRALVLFAQRRYQDAAATIYAVLAVGPGWDWPTMSSFYRDPQIYTAQLRALENYTRANPKDAAARFLLAYHYLTTDYRDAAISTLRSVVALQPNDQLAAYLLKMLENNDQPGGPAPGK